MTGIFTLTSNKKIELDKHFRKFFSTLDRISWVRFHCVAQNETRLVAVNISKVGAFFMLIIFFRYFTRFYPFHLIICTATARMASPYNFLPFFQKKKKQNPPHIRWCTGALPLPLSFSCPYISLCKRSSFFL